MLSRRALTIALPWLLGLPHAATAAPYAPRLPALRVKGHYFETSEGKPFFWLGDTAWQLFHSLTLDDAGYYLQTRAAQGFTVIQAVVLAELDGITKPTPEGFTPFAGNDPARPNAAYFDKVAAIVERADALGLYVALLPSWADKMTAPWGAGPRLFPADKPEIAAAYGRFLGARLKGRRNIIWMLGGDRPARIDGQSYEYLRSNAKKAGFPDTIDWKPVWGAMAKGIRDGYGEKPLMTYHPDGGDSGTAEVLADAQWMDFNGLQSGHGQHDAPVWKNIARDFARGKPVLDLEPCYEDHPVAPWPVWDPATGYFDDYDVRKQTWRSVLAGGAGVTYGHHSVWQAAGARGAPLNHAFMDWQTALQRPGARQMRFLRALIESRPMAGRVPGDDMITAGQGEGGLHMVAARDADGRYALVYMPMPSQTVTVDLSRLKAQSLRGWWYDPRLGIARPAGTFSGATVTITSPAQGPDWVLVLDDAATGFPPPGQPG